MFASLRIGCWGIILVLLGRWCDVAPPPLTARHPAATRLARPAASWPVAPFIQELLDTAAAGSARAADARLGLRLGAEVRAFYGAAGTPAWTEPSDSLNPAGQAVLALLARAPAYGLPPDYASAKLRALRDSLASPGGAPTPRARQQARLEVYLTDAALRLGRDLSRGRLRPYTPSARERAGAPGPPSAAALRAALGGGQAVAALLAGQPRNREYQLLQRALERWLAQPTPPDSAARHRAQYEQAALNLERWRWDAWPADTSEYALVNLPAFELVVVAGNSVRRRHRVVVGKPATPTPTLSSTIRYFTLHPDWEVPRSIATKGFLPRLRRNPNYLAQNSQLLFDERGRALDPTRIDWQRVSAGAFLYTIRQVACCDNALGNIVFRFNNPYSVYLHDTPTRQLFAQPSRALSHGCMRLAEPMQLAAYLLRREGRPANLPSAEECARYPRPQTVYLRRPLPLRVRYATCAAEGGQLRFFADVYGRDEVLRRGLFGPARPAGSGAAGHLTNISR